MAKIDISDKTIGILGMTFKGGIDDFRDSLSFRLKRLLESKARQVLCSDTQLQKCYFVETEYLVEKSDIIIIDIDNCDMITKQFVTFMLSLPDTHYITSDEITPYGLISKNRIYDLDWIAEQLTANDEEEDDEENNEG